MLPLLPLAADPSIEHHFAASASPFAGVLLLPLPLALPPFRLGSSYTSPADRRAAAAAFPTATSLLRAPPYRLYAVSAARRPISGRLPVAVPQSSLCGSPSHPPNCWSGLEIRPDPRGCKSSPEESPENKASPDMAMAPPRQARRDISIEGMTRPVAVDHRISLPYYFRIADNLLRQANIYREENNLLDLYIILLRYSSLLTETIPKHRDYHAFKSREKEFLKKGPHNSDKLLNVISELESLKPIVKRQIAELNRGGAEEPNGAANSASSRMDQLTPSPYMAQPLFGSSTGLLQKSFSRGKHQEAPLQGVKPDRQLVKSYANLPYPKEETLSRHSILGPNGLHGQWTGPVTGVKIQYPSYPELTQSDIPSLVPAILNQDSSYGPSTTSQGGPTNNNGDMQSVLSLDDGRWSSQDPASVSPTGFEEEFSQLNIRQPSPPPVLAQVHPERRPISPSRVADPRPGLATCDTGRYQNLHVPVALMESFLRLAEANTANNLETCGILAGHLKKRTFYVTTLIIPKQKSTSDSCQATNEEEIFEVQDKGSLFTLGWIHTHPTQTCFLSSIDLHNHYSYQVMLPEAIAIVMAPTDSTRKHGIFHLTDPGGMGVIHDCQESGFHPHEEPLDGTSIYEHCSHVYMNPSVKFDMVDLRQV